MYLFLLVGGLVWATGTLDGLLAGAVQVADGSVGCRAYGEAAWGRMYLFEQSVCGSHLSCVSSGKPSFEKIATVLRATSEEKEILFYGFTGGWTGSATSTGWEDSGDEEEEDEDGKGKTRLWPQQLRTKLKLLNPAGAMARGSGRVDEVCETNIGQIEVHFFCRLLAWPYDVLLSVGELGGAECVSPLRHWFIPFVEKGERRRFHVRLRKRVVFDAGTVQPKDLQEAVLNSVQIKMLLRGDLKFPKHLLKGESPAKYLSSRCRTIVKLTCKRWNTQIQPQEEPTPIFEVSGGIDASPITSKEDLKKYAFVDPVGPVTASAKLRLSNDFVSGAVTQQRA